MTLPNPDKPSITDLVSTIVTDIQENCAYLEAEPSSYCVKILTRTTTDGSGNSAVTGVGFEPRIIIFFNMSSYGGGGIGWYGPSTTYNSFGLCRRRRVTSLMDYTDNWFNASSYAGYYWSVFFWTYFGPLTNNMRGRVASVNDDGFVYTWNLSYNDMTESYYVVALCIK